MSKKLSEILIEACEAVPTANDPECLLNTALSKAYPLRVHDCPVSGCGVCYEQTLACLAGLVRELEEREEAR